MNETKTIHERVCALMRDGRVRSVHEVIVEVGSNVNGVYPVLARLETEETLTTLADPVSGHLLYVWADA